MFYFESETISGVGGLCFEGNSWNKKLRYREEQQRVRRA